MRSHTGNPMQICKQRGILRPGLISFIFFFQTECIIHALLSSWPPYQVQVNQKSALFLNLKSSNTNLLFNNRKLCQFFNDLLFIKKIHYKCIFVFLMKKQMSAYFLFPGLAALLSQFILAQASISENTYCLRIDSMVQAFTSYNVLYIFILNCHTFSSM